MWTNSRPHFVHTSMKTHIENTETVDSEGKKTIIFSSFLQPGAGNNPMVGMTVACAVAIEEAVK